MFFSNLARNPFSLSLTVIDFWADLRNFSTTFSTIQSEFGMRVSKNVMEHKKVTEDKGWKIRYVLDCCPMEKKVSAPRSVYSKTSTSVQKKSQVSKTSEISQVSRTSSFISKHPAQWLCQTSCCRMQCKCSQGCGYKLGQDHGSD